MRSVGKASGKWSPNRHEQLIANKEQRRISDQRAAKTYDNSIPYPSPNTSDSFSSGSHQYQIHPKWREFADYCHSQGGQPTKKGFRTWLSRQTPYWRNKTRPNPDGEPGYDLDGKFLTECEAIQYAGQHPKLLEQNSFRKAIRRRDGTIKIIAT